MTLVYKSYFEVVEEWKKKYPIPKQLAVFNPTTIRRKECLRCGSQRKVQRHHTGNDFHFACLRPDLYASTYLQFLPAQTADLCDNCHKLVHENIRKMMLQVKKEMVTEFSKQTFVDTLHKFPTKEFCDKWMQEFRSWFDKWVKRPPRKRKRRRKNANN